MTEQMRSCRVATFRGDERRKSLSVIGQRRQSHATLPGHEKTNSMMSHSHLTLSAESAALSHHGAIIRSGTIGCRQAKHKEKSVLKKNIRGQVCLVGQSTSISVAMLSTS